MSTKDSKPKLTSKTRNYLRYYIHRNGGSYCMNAKDKCMDYKEFGFIDNYVINKQYCTPILKRKKLRATNSEDETKKYSKLKIRINANKANNDLKYSYTISNIISIDGNNFDIDNEYYINSDTPVSTSQTEILNDCDYIATVN
mmetsp:Transcript_29407/g.36060  ORF Transcript_29407/g.36060 Transcript_29407/m.36060 type:complete len:143 (+) Transcript_29407:22-450(+)